LAARQRADLPLLRRALEVEPGAVRARRHGALAHLDLVLAVRDLLPHRRVRPQRVTRLVDVADHDRLADAQRDGVGLLLTGHHAEQRRLAGAVRPDHADDPAPRQREVHIVHEQDAAVALAQAARLDDDVAEPRTRRDVDFGRLDLLRDVLVQQLLVRVQAGLALRLARARRHADPFQLALQRALPLRLGLLLRRQARLLLFEPRGVVPLPRDAVPAI